VPIDIIQFIIIFIIITFGAMLQGSLGFGLGPLSVPLLLLIDPGFIPGPLLLVSIYLTFFMFRRERNDFHKASFSWAIMGRILGSVAGAMLLVIIPAEHLSLFYGGLIIFAVLLSISGWKLAMVPKNYVLVGTLSGMMATAVAMGGPAMALIYQHGTGSRLRSTLSAIFLLGSFISLGALLWVGRLGLPEVQKALILLPGIILGFYLSRYSLAALDKKYLRPAILMVSTLSSIVLIFNNI